MTEHLAVDDMLDVAEARERQRSRQHLRGPGGGRALVATPDGQHRGGRTSLKAALRPWQFVVQDGDDDDAA